MKLLTPELELLADVNAAELDSFLSRHGLASCQSGSADISIAFPLEFHAVVNQVLNNQLQHVRYKGLRQFPQAVSTMLESEHVVAFVPTRNEMREFFDTKGFITCMRTLSSQLGDVKVVLPPGKYGVHHMVVWKRCD